VIRSARELKATTGQPVRLIVIDTLARVMGAGDENSTQAMNTVLNSAKRIQRETGAAVLIVHHEGKDASRGSRGSSALPAAIDVAFGMVKDAMRIDLMRDGEEGTTFPFSLWRWTLDRTRTANL
jgi:RecA-family ATPase